jgi:hypothetical protein
MSAITGVIRKGQVIMTQRANLPDETEVEIILIGLAGSADDEGTMSPDKIARTLAAMNEIEPSEMSDEERAAIAANRRAHWECEKARFDEHADRLRSLWE